MIVLDASAMIAVMDGHDAHHASAMQIMERAKDSDRVLAMHPVTLAEVLAGVVGTKQEADTLAVLDSNQLQVEPFRRASAISVARLRASTGLKLPDACVLSAAVTREASIATFDVRLAREARRLGVDVLGIGV